MEDKLKAVSQAYSSGYTCSQSVFYAFAQDMGIEDTVALRLMAGFGSKTHCCGAFAAASAIVGFFCSDGSPGGGDVTKAQRAVDRLAEIFYNEYGYITCPGASDLPNNGLTGCGMRVKDTVLIIKKVLDSHGASQKGNIPATLLTSQSAD